MTRRPGASPAEADEAAHATPGAALFAAAADLDGVLVVVVDGAGAIVAARGSALPGVAPGLGEAVGRPYASAITGAPVLAESLGAALRGNTTTRRLWGKGAVVELRAAPVRDRQGDITGAVALGTDARPLADAERALAGGEDEDAVTGLARAPALLRMLAAAGAAAARDAAVAVVHARLEDLALADTALGREAGDALLRDAAGRLSEAFPEAAMIARVDGTGLVVVLTSLTGNGSDAASAAAARTAIWLAGNVALPGGEARRAAKVGVAVAPRDATGARELLEFAEHGVAANVPGEVARERLRVTTRLPGAAERGELRLVYQPIFSLHDRRPYGAEALLRWEDPEHGPVSPGRFVPVAEETGAVHELGSWVIEEICRHARQWSGHRIALRLHFNASRVELARPNYAADLLKILQRYGISPGRFVLELTDSAHTATEARAVGALEQLREAGLTIALGRFGSEDSSLSRLGELPVDMLKIDRTLLAGIPGGREATAIVGACIRLAGDLRLGAVAEGIETQTQEAWLLRQECPLGQGFWFSRPGPAGTTGLVG